MLSCYSDFDAIFLDMRMGGMNGKETAQEIRKRDPFVILSFYSLFTENAHSITDFHPFKYILKDWDEKKLMSDIEQVLKEWKESRCMLDLILMIKQEYTHFHGIRRLEMDFMPCRKRVVKQNFILWEQMKRSQLLLDVETPINAPLVKKD